MVRHLPFSQIRLLRALGFRFFCLVFVSAENPSNHWPEFFLQLLASSRVLKLNTFALATNQTGFTEDLEMLRQRGLGKLRVATGQKGGAVHGALGLSQFRVDANPNGVGEGIQDSLHGYLFERWMIKWPHTGKLSQFDKIVHLFHVTEQWN